MREPLERSGAVFAAGSQTPEHFGDPAAELRHACERVVLADRSDLARLRATGPDILDLLHRLSTADVQKLAPGDDAQTVLTTSKGRIVERLFLTHLGESGVFMVGGPGKAGRIADHLNRFTFAERTGLSAVTQSEVLLTLTGPAARQALSALAPTAFDVLGHDGTSTDGFALVVSSRDAPAIWAAAEAAVREAGGTPAGSIALENRRVLLGLPAAGHELTEDHNPLEAGLWDAVSFDKGCYVGQEVVARLRTYDKVSRSIVGLRLEDDSAEQGATLFHDGRNVGKITSVVTPPGWDAPFALAYLKRKEIAPGLRLGVGLAEAPASATLVELPAAP